MINVRMWLRHRDAVADLNQAIENQNRIDPVWRLKDLEAKRDKIPDAENGALQVQRAARHFPEKWREPKEVSVDSVPPEQKLTPGQIVELESILEPLSKVREAALRMTQYRRGRYKVVYDANPLMTLLEPQQQSTYLASVLKWDAFLSIAKKDDSRAQQCCEALYHLARIIGDEPIEASQLIRLQEMETCLDVLERILAQSTPSLAFLQRFRLLLQEEDQIRHFERMAHAARATFHELMFAIEQGRASSDVEKDNFLDRQAESWYQDTVRLEHVRAFPLIQQVVTISNHPSHQRDLSSVTAQFSEKTFPIAHLFVVAFETFHQRAMHCHARLRCLMVAVALEERRRASGSWPTTLSELTPKLLKTIPHDPYTGKDLRYRQVKQRVMVYAFGKDRTDNQGNLSREREPPEGTDVGIHLRAPKPDQ